MDDLKKEMEQVKKMQLMILIIIATEAIALTASTIVFHHQYNQILDLILRTIRSFVNGYL